MHMNAKNPFSSLFACVRIHIISLCALLYICVYVCADVSRFAYHMRARERDGEVEGSHPERISIRQIESTIETNVEDNQQPHTRLAEFTVGGRRRRIREEERTFPVLRILLSTLHHHLTLTTVRFSCITRCSTMLDIRQQPFTIFRVTYLIRRRRRE